jgi:hydrogenase maturation protein HypF
MQSVPRDDAGRAKSYRLSRALPRPVLALGGQMKACLALGIGRDVLVSSDLGDLGTPLGLEALEATASSLRQNYGVAVDTLICDAHPGYTSARWARGQDGVEVRRVFHHYAHAAAVAGEFPGEARWLCFTWDGVGLGPDGTLWGGEALLGAPGFWQRVATFRPFAPPGGEMAARAPWRSAAALAWALGLDFSPPARDVTLAKAAWRRGVNCPPTSAVGRLFDAAASFLDLVHDAGFEAEGPIAVQAVASDSTGMACAIGLPLHSRNDGVLEADWAPLVMMLRNEGRSQSERAAAFHASMALTPLVQAIALRELHGDFAIGLSGGVFQNALLARLARDALVQAGFRVYLPEEHPCHDGGLSFGQIVEAAHSP